MRLSDEPVEFYSNWYKKYLPDRSNTLLHLKSLRIISKVQSFVIPFLILCFKKQVRNRENILKNYFKSMQQTLRKYYFFLDEKTENLNIIKKELDFISEEITNNKFQNISIEEFVFNESSSLFLMSIFYFS